jgi:hypothetical protein
MTAWFRCCGGRVSRASWVIGCRPRTTAAEARVGCPRPECSPSDCQLTRLPGASVVCLTQISPPSAWRSPSHVSFASTSHAVITKIARAAWAGVLVVFERTSLVNVWEDQALTAAAGSLGVAIGPRKWESTDFQLVLKNLKDSRTRRVICGRGEWSLASILPADAQFELFTE